LYPNQYPNQYPSQYPNPYQPGYPPPPYGGGPYQQAPGYPPPPQQPAQQRAEWSGGDPLAKTREKRVTVSFDQAPVGTRRTVLVDSLPAVTQATKWEQNGRGTPEFWPDGNPKWTVGILGVNENGELASWWVRRPSAGYRAVVDAQDRTGLKVKRSTIVVITLTELRPTTGYPQKIYAVELFGVDSSSWGLLTPAQQGVYTQWTKDGTHELDDHPDNVAEAARQAEAPAQQAQAPRPPAPQAYPQPPAQQAYPQPPAQAYPWSQQQAAPQGYPAQQPQAPAQQPAQQPFPTPQAPAQQPAQQPFPTPQRPPQAALGADAGGPKITATRIPPDVLAALIPVPDEELQSLGYDPAEVRREIEAGRAAGTVPPM
jgi:hypothetical protein